MSTKYLSGAYIAHPGYTTSGVYDTIDIRATCTIGPSGFIGLAGSYTTSGNYVINNLGTVTGHYGYGVYLEGGGSVTNGSTNNTHALIAAPERSFPYGFSAGVRIQAPGTVTNYATITAGADGVRLALGGRVTNGAPTDTAALIEGERGVVIQGNPGTVTNFASIIANGGTTNAAVYLNAGGLVTNGSGGDTTALIRGNQAIESLGVATVANFGSIIGVGGDGVSLHNGGLVTNGGGPDRVALISGASGVVFTQVAGTVRNFGTIEGNGSVFPYCGVALNAGGALTNGSATNTTALIEGYDGVALYGAAAVNLGTILALGDASGVGAQVFAGSSLVNGAAGHAGAFISGYYGVIGGVGAQITNFGTIVGLAAQAVLLTSSTASLVVEAGCSFSGSVNGGGGTLVLANGTGTVTGLLAGGNVTVSGSMATTTFNNFATVQIDTGASFALAGAGGTIGAGQALNLFGTLSGAGTLALTGGTTTLGTGASLTIAKVTQATGATAAFTALVTVSDQWTQTGGTITVATGDRASFKGVGDSFAGTLAGVGSVYFTGGTDALTGTTLSAANVVVAGGAATLSGAISLTKLLTVTSPNLTIAAAGATLSGGGTLFLNTLATSAVIGASAAATLTNNDKIQGTGQLGDGQLTLINGASGSINAYLTTALTINTGTGSFANAGLIESTNTGGLTITGALANTGTLLVTKGTLLVNGAVTGAGTVKIGGGTADFASTFSENVTFTGTTGVLELAKSQTYTGQVTGLAVAGTSSLDLLDITFGGTTKATYSGTVTSGTLTVTDGTHTSHITLIGNYLGHTFTTSSDGHGGTTVVDPTKPNSGGHVVPLITAIAGFGPGGGGEAWLSTFEGRLPRPSGMATPHFQ